jgi:hypothetical protein
MIKPLHVATIGGHPLRFFCTPIDDGRPDLPWHAVDDLHRCLGLNRAARKLFLSKLRTFWKEPRTVATADGLVTVAPHFMAQGTIDAVVEEGMAPAGVRAEYDLAGSEALKKLIPPPSESGMDADAWLSWLKAATNRWNDAKPKNDPA